MSKISIHSFSEVDQFYKSQKIDPNDAKKVRNYFYRRGFTLDEKINRVSPELQQLSNQNFKCRFLTLEKRLDSKIDGASKLLFKTHDGHQLESVILRIASGRSSLCISSQCGCKFGCKFCATGTLGFKRNLTKDEILDQVVQCAQLLAKEGRQLRNVVFMGMGEPLDNYDEVCQAIALLINPTAFAFSPTSIMVSTCGVIGKIVPFVTQFPKVNLAISLHAAKDEQRQGIMPINKKHNLAALKATLTQVSEVTERPIMLEYLLLNGVNDSEEDMGALVLFCEGLKTKVNLISYNSQGKSDPFKQVEPVRTQELKAILQNQGLEVTLRYSLGQDIEAACGQLAGSKK